MRKNSKIIAITIYGFVIIALILGTSLAIGCVRQSTLESGLTVQIEEVAHGQIGKSYKTIDELIIDSTIIVLGFFEGQERIISPNISNPPRDPGRREMTFVVTDAFKGNSQARIQVAQRYTQKENYIAAVKDDTLFTSGTEYILFLVSALPQEGNFYWLTGATQGAFLVNQNKVFSRNVLGEIPKEVGPISNGTTLDQFLLDIKKLIR